MDERDRGLYICTWPNGGKPEIPIQYSDKVWSTLWQRDHSTRALPRRR
jgi:hypothetical protein